MDDRAVKAVLYGGIYAFAFMAVIGGLLVLLLPHLALSRPAIIGLVAIGVLTGVVVGIRQGLKKERSTK